MVDASLTPDGSEQGFLYSNWEVLAMLLCH